MERGREDRKKEASQAQIRGRPDERVGVCPELVQLAMHRTCGRRSLAFWGWGASKNGVGLAALGNVNCRLPAIREPRRLIGGEMAVAIQAGTWQYHTYGSRYHQVRYCRCPLPSVFDLSA